MKDVYIHYGSTHFRPEAFETPKNTWWIKPLGGFWASLKNSECAFTWKDWLIEEGYSKGGEDHWVCFTLKDDANVCYIKTMTDFIKLPRYTVENPWHLSSDKVDFEKCLEMGIDAIELRCFGNWPDAEYAVRQEFCGWDCDSILILNPDCIEKEW